MPWLITSEGRIAHYRRTPSAELDRILDGLEETIPDANGNTLNHLTADQFAGQTDEPVPDTETDEDRQSTYEEQTADGEI